MKNTTIAGVISLIKRKLYNHIILISTQYFDHTIINLRIFYKSRSYSVVTIENKSSL